MHRRQMAGRGGAVAWFPSTRVLQRLAALYRLRERDRIAHPDERLELAEAGLLPPSDRAALVARLTGR